MGLLEVSVVNSFEGVTNCSFQQNSFYQECVLMEVPYDYENADHIEINLINADAVDEGIVERVLTFR